MMRFMLICLSMMSVLSIWPSNWETIDLKTLRVIRSGTDVAAPKCEIREETDGSFTVTYLFDEIERRNNPQYDGESDFRLRGFSVYASEGNPAWLRRVDRFVVPAGTTPILKIVDVQYRTLPFKVARARKQRFDSELPTTFFDEVPPINPYDGIRPAESAMGTVGGQHRGNGTYEVMVCPLQTAYGYNSTRCCTKLVYRVSFEASNNNDGPVIIKNPSRAAGYVNCTNYDNIELLLPEHIDYLILANNMFSEQAYEFAKWKSLLGFHVAIEYVEANESDVAVKARISEAYRNLDNLQYVLLLGNSLYLPLHEETEYYFSYDFYSDYWYTCLDGEEDKVQDIYIGRLPASNPKEAQRMVEKIISYEKEPYTDPSIYKKGLHCAYFEDAVSPEGFEDLGFVKTSEEIRSAMTDNGFDITRVYYAEPYVNPRFWNDDYFGLGTLIPSELLRPAFTWAGDAHDITSSFNSGQSYVLYRGHGENTQWNNPLFTNKDVANLANRYNLPVVFSITCNTGKSNVSLAKALLDNSQGGGVAVIAATEVSPSAPGDFLAEGMFNAVWPQCGLVPAFPGVTENVTDINSPCVHLGEILESGMGFLDSLYPNEDEEDTRTIMKKLYHIFGDPGMVFRTENLGSVPFRIKTEPGVLPDMYMVTITIQDGVFANIVAYDSAKGVVGSGTGKSLFMFYRGDSDITVCVSAPNYTPSVFKLTGLRSPKLTSVSVKSGVVEVECEVPEGTGSAIVEVSSVTGMVEGFEKINDVHEESAHVTIGALEPGFHIVQLIVDGAVADSKSITLN